MLERCNAWVLDGASPWQAAGCHEETAYMHVEEEDLHNIPEQRCWQVPLRQLTSPT